MNPIHELEVHPKKRDPDLAYFTSSKDSAADEPSGNRYDPNK
jgi:hypothetical protein